MSSAEHRLDRSRFGIYGVVIYHLDVEEFQFVLARLVERDRCAAS